MAKERISIIVSPDLLAKLGEDIEIRISLKDGSDVASGSTPVSNVDGDMLSYMEGIVNEKKAAGKLRTAETYQTTLSRWFDFMKTTSLGIGPDGKLHWSSLSQKLVGMFQRYLERRKVSKNTQSFYFRILRATCNRARHDGHDVADGLFNDVYTGKAKTKKRALHLADIKCIAKAETVGGKEKLARDMFIFSFITRGMSMIDIAHLKKSNIVNGRLTYKRHKTENTVSMAWIMKMQQIADEYKNSSKTYMFPIMPAGAPDARHTYKKVQLRINYHLKKLGKRLGLPIPLTMYVARHSWATIAKASGVPTAVISDALGHTSEKTTQIYLASIDEGLIDSTNQKIVDQIFDCG